MFPQAQPRDGEQRGLFSPASGFCCPKPSSSFPRLPCAAGSPPESRPGAGEGAIYSPAPPFRSAGPARPALLGPSSAAAACLPATRHPPAAIPPWRTSAGPPRPLAQAGPARPVRPRPAPDKCRASEPLHKDFYAALGVLGS